MWILIKRLVKSAAPSTYKIVHDPKLGYVPAFKDNSFGWRAIDGHGEVSQYIDAISDPMWSQLWVSTEEAAGERINLHATSRGRTEVWSA